MKSKFWNLRHVAEIELGNFKIQTRIQTILAYFPKKVSITDQKFFTLQTEFINTDFVSLLTKFQNISSSCRDIEPKSDETYRKEKLS